jgi:hypothetical protein
VNTGIRKPNWADRERVILLAEYEKRKVILKGKFSSSITSGDKNRARQEIANIEKKKKSRDRKTETGETKTKHGKE